jgi:magnesium transporter
MKEKLSLDKVKELIENRDIKNLKAFLMGQHHVDIAGIIEELEPEQALKLFTILTFDTAIKVLEEIQSDRKYYILSHVKPIFAAQLIEQMSPDDTTDFLGDLPEEKRKEILLLLEEKDKEGLNELLSYDKNSAGGLMTTEYIAFSKELKAQDVLNKLGELAPDVETIYYIYVVDSNNKLAGVLSLRDLILAPKDTPISEIMQTDVKKVKASQDQEEVLQLFKKYGFLALPVVNENNTLLGIVTVDDIMLVVEEEATEDILKLAGSNEMIDLENSPPWMRAKKRLPWILVAVVGEILSGRILDNFSYAITAIVALSFFVPVLMDMGGNVGTQSAAIVVRGLATGEINPILMAKNIIREAAIGSILGILNGLILALVVYLWQGSIKLGLVLIIAMLFNLTFAAILGAFIPLFWHKIGRDPAVASGPLVTTVLDIIGLFIYFSVASWILEI